MLDEVSGEGSQVSAGTVTTIRLLMLTGCRKTEIMTLRWEHADLDRAEMRIVNGKTGDRTAHISPSAVNVLAALPREPDCPWVVPGAKPGRHMADIDGAWQTIRARAGPHDVRTRRETTTSALGTRRAHIATSALRHSAPTT